jgi:hypothetical protein
MIKTPIRRHRPIYLSLILLSMVCGLLSRSQYVQLPTFIATYAGDTIWALMVFFGIGFIAVNRKTVEVAIVAILFSVAIEFSQLYQAPWINEIREIKIFGLILGYGFKYSDLICYLVGISLAVCTELLILKRRSEIVS